MSNTDRRFALALGFAATGGALAASSPAVAQPYRPDQGEEVGPGVRRVQVSQRTPMAGRDNVLPGYKSIRVVDYIFQPEAKDKSDTMPMDMVCQCIEGELSIDHRHGHSFDVRKGDVWTCAKGQAEDVVNTGNTTGIMRVILLMPA